MNQILIISNATNTHIFPTIPTIPTPPQIVGIVRNEIVECMGANLGGSTFGKWAYSPKCGLDRTQVHNS